MEIDGLKVLQGRKDELNLKDFINPDFIDILEKQLGSAKIVHLGIATGPEDEESLIVLAHNRSEHVKDNIVTITVSKDEQMNQILDAIKSYKEE